MIFLCNAVLVNKNQQKNFFSKKKKGGYLHNSVSESVVKGKDGPSKTPAIHWQAPFSMLKLNHNIYNISCHKHESVINYNNFFLAFFLIFNFFGIFLTFCW